jgi:chemotaxis protein methyltransferase CheR
MEESTLNSIERYVHERTGLCFTGHKKRLLRQRLAERILLLGLADLDTYRELLFASDSEGSSLLELLTTNETFFFRNPRQFDYLMENIVPALEDEKGRDVMRSWAGDIAAPPASIMKLRILCAGCSTGEEPYSVAMSLLSTLRYPRAWDIEILAGDLNESCIRAAKKGFYDEERVKGLPHAFRDRYTEHVPGGLLVTDEVKRLTRFSVLNLNDIVNGGSFPGVHADFAGFDIIFCRNVMIYFSLASQQLLVDLLYRSLLPGGYLFTGDAEPLHLYKHEFAAVRDVRCLIYQKAETGADARSV